jgi:hypothetical protein
LWEGKVLDGRNRLRACRLAGIDPQVRELAELPGVSPIAYVLAVNLHRRHLQPSQLGMVGARARALFDEEARRRKVRKAKSLPENSPGQKGDARDQAGGIVGVSGRTVDAATAVLRSGAPEVIEACDRGQLTVYRAARLVRLPKEKQRAAMQGGREAIAAALRELEPAARGAAFERVKRLLRCAMDMEDAVVLGWGNLHGALQDGGMDAESAQWCAEQLNGLSARFARLAAAVSAPARSGSKSAMGPP